MLRTHYFAERPCGASKAFGQAGESVWKKLLIHADLIDGLKSDEYAMEFLAQEVQPDGIITTRNSVVLAAKKKG